ncbi:MAG: DNRLRE domain-containing protein [Actinomycetota bacterium]|nr:DNRLRE domain-containing protein [Actinomycetota bacterium]
MFTKYMSPTERDRLLDRLASTGADTVQTAGPWDHLEPYSDDSYDWAFMDQFIAAAEARGLKVRMQVMATPDWVHPELVNTEPTQRNRVFTPPRGEQELALYEDFFHDLVKRYGTRVASYEVWNEPNLDSFFQPKANVAEYAAMLRRAYLGAKRANPNVTIVGGALSQNDLGYLDQLYTEIDKYPEAAANNRFFDVLGLHPYANLGQTPLAPSDTNPKAVCSCPFGKRDTTFLGIDKMKANMEAHGDTSKKVWIGEFGYHTGSAWTQPVSDQVRSEYLKEAYALLDSRPWVIGMSWFAYYREAGEGWNIYDRTSGQETLTFQAFKEAASGSTAPPPPVETLTLAPSADARVQEGSPKRNYGSSTALIADGDSGNHRLTFLKFDVSGVGNKTIQNATLRLYVKNGGGSANGPSVRRSANTWTEGGVTWNNRPAPETSPQDNKGAVSNSSWMTFDVTNLVSADGTVTLTVQPDSTDDTETMSKEGSFKPRLVLTLGG